MSELVTIAFGGSSSNRELAVAGCLARAAAATAAGVVDVTICEPVYTAEDDTWTAMCKGRAKPDEIDAINAHMDAQALH